MAHVLSLGGVFLRCRDHQKMRDWYAEMLEIDIQSWGGAIFPYKNDLERHPDAYNNLSFFKADTKYLEPSESGFMLNFRVRDLDGLLKKMAEKGATLVGEPSDSEYGKFAWAIDPEGNKIELWQPPV